MVGMGSGPCQAGHWIGRVAFQEAANQPVVRGLAPERMSQNLLLLRKELGKPIVSKSRTAISPSTSPFLHLEQKKKEMVFPGLSFSIFTRSYVYESIPCSSLG